MSRKFCFLFQCLLPIVVLAQGSDSLPASIETFQLKMDILPSKTASLSWRNYAKTAGGYFFLERRADAGNFETIVTLRLKDSSSGEYRALDERPFPGTNHYRIRFVDGAGQTTYSHSVAADIVSGNFCRFYPNPADDHIIVQTAAKTVIQIFSPNGQQIFTQNLEKGLVPLDLSSFRRGIYVIVFNNTETRASIRNILYKN